MAQLKDLDYEEIENAVMETARGRWFLTEHKKRNCSVDTSTVLEAINKLEKVISSMNQDGRSKKVDKTEEVTSKSATKNITIPPAQVIEAQEVEPLGEENLQFFSQEEDLFADENNYSFDDLAEPEKTTRKASKSAKDSPANPTDQDDKSKNTKPFRERFKIFKSKSHKQTSETTGSQAAEESNDVPDISMRATSDEQDRIVVIRKSADKDIKIPLADEAEESVSKKKTTQANS